MISSVRVSYLIMLILLYVPYSRGVQSEFQIPEHCITSFGALKSFDRTFVKGNMDLHTGEVFPTLGEIFYVKRVKHTDPYILKSRGGQKGETYEFSYFTKPFNSQAPKVFVVDKNTFDTNYKKKLQVRILLDKEGVSLYDAMAEKPHYEGKSYFTNRLYLRFIMDKTGEGRKNKITTLVKVHRDFKNKR
jgi:hypothetical protein